MQLTLTEEELRRYRRTITLPEVGSAHPIVNNHEKKEDRREKIR